MDPLTMFECSVCLEPFDAEKHRPKLVSCGHTFCRSCLQEIAARDGTTPKCPEDRNTISVRNPMTLKDNKFIMSWLEELKTRQQREARLAAGPAGDRPCREAVLQEVQRQVEAALSQCRKPSGSSQAGAAKLDNELKLLTSSEPVSLWSRSWRAEGLELSDQPALRLAILLLIHQGQLQELEEDQEEEEDDGDNEEDKRPVPLLVVDVGVCCDASPSDQRAVKRRTLQRNIPIHVLKGVRWHRDPCWIGALLLGHAGSLQELEVSLLDSNGASDLARLPQLHTLHLSNCMESLSMPDHWQGRLRSVRVQDVSREMVLGLLRAHRDSLQEVVLDWVDRDQLAELQRMPALRKLTLSEAHEDLISDPELSGAWRVQLQELQVMYFVHRIPPETVLSLLRAHRDSLQVLRMDWVNRDQLLELRHMPALRTLTLRGDHEDLQDDPVLPDAWQGQLQVLEVSRVLPEETVLSLLRAHGGSLRKVILDVGRQPEPESFCDLPALLQRCGLQRLRTLELWRYRCEHSPLCVAQQVAFRALLPGCVVKCREVC